MNYSSGPDGNQRSFRVMGASKPQCSREKSDGHPRKYPARDRNRSASQDSRPVRALDSANLIGHDRRALALSRPRATQLKAGPFFCRSRPQSNIQII